MSLSLEPRGNLIEYGIKQEQTDYRCHVCFGEWRIYIYKTADGRKAIESNAYASRSAKQPGVDHITALGYAVPVNHIPGIRGVEIPFWRGHCPVTKDSSTSEKGRAAVRCIQAMLERGLMPISLGSSEVGNQKMQIQGTDIVIYCQLRIQVKCDWDGGFNGTGNLYIQTHELNPLGRH